MEGISLDQVALTNGHALGASTNLDAAIISPTHLSIPLDVFIGLPSLAELIKRLSIFMGDIAIALDVLSNRDTAHLVVSAGAPPRLNYVCTLSRQMRYPNTNEDVPAAVIKLTKPRPRAPSALSR